MDFGLAEFEKRLPDAEEVLSQAANIMAIGARTDELMDSIGHTWMMLTQPGVYSVPGNEVVFTALDPARTAAADLANYTIQLDTVMKSYADSLAWLKIRYEDLKARAAAFNAEYPESEKDEWDDDGRVVGTRNTLASDVARLFEDLDEDQREAANRIANITGSGRTYAETGDLDPGDTAYGHDYSDYAAEYSGDYLSKDLPWYRDTLNFAGDTVVGIGQAGWETLAGVGVLIGFRGADERSAAWKGMYRVGENLFIFGPGRSLASDERAALAVAELGLLGTQIIRMDQWNSDRPGLGLGGNIFDVGTLFLGGAAAGGAKAGIKAGTSGGWPGAGRWPGIRTGMDEFGGLVPAIPGGQLPMFPDSPRLPNNDTMFRGGKPREFSPEYSPSGRDPSAQPQPGDADGGNGYFSDVGRNLHGAPEQQYITGIDRVDGNHAREYALERPDGKPVHFDGHSWRDGTQVFTEVKGHYDFFNNFGPDNLLDIKVKGFLDELQNQQAALKHSAGGPYIYEWVFTEKVVADAFQDLLRKNPAFAKGVVVRFEPMP